MKKITLLLFTVLSISFMDAQTRLVLVEEFTQASCGPCAVQNPAFNALLAANPTKVIPLKYQTSWPGTDPMNADNPTEVADRVSYYGVSGVPNSFLDGDVILGSSYDGAPANLDQAKIDARHAVSAPFSMNVSHSFNPTYSEITVTCVLENVSGATVNSGSAGSLKLHVAVVEEEINFPSAPGSNGEMDFSYVMRDMIPDANGTTLVDAWLAGDNDTYTFTVPVPSYIYSIGEIGVVAFVQEDDTKEVHQAGYSEPIAVSLPDVSATLTSSTDIDICDNSYTPTVSITNESSITITTVEFESSVNGGAAVTDSWSGSLAAGASETITLPSVTLSGGINNIEVSVTSVNGTADMNSLNNSIPTIVAPIQWSAAVPTDYTMDFEATADYELPANMLSTGNMFVLSKAGVADLTQDLGGYEASLKSMFYYFYNTGAGDEMEMITEKIDFSSASNPDLVFSHAYAQYTTENDQLVVSYSTDCGASWNTVFDKAGTDLATADPLNSGNFFPVAAEWTTNVVNIPAIANAPEVMFSFKGISAYGNNLYVDDIKIGQDLSSVGENSEMSFSVYPNPSNGDFNVALSNVNNAIVNVLSVDGKIVETHNLQSTVNNLTVSGLSAGVYFVQVSSNDFTRTERVVVR